MTLRNSPTDSKLQSKIQTGAKFITICLAILHTVAYKCQRTKNILLHEQVPDLVVNTIQLVPNNDKLSCYAVRLLKVLSVCQNNKARFLNMNQNPFHLRWWSILYTAIEIEVWWLILISITLHFQPSKMKITLTNVNKKTFESKNSRMWRNYDIRKSYWD